MINSKILYVSLIVIIIVVITIYFVYVSETQIKELGKLTESCPCEDGLVCDVDICKKPTYDDCDDQVECKETDICFNQICVPRPSSYKEKRFTDYDGHNIRLRSHLFVYREDKLVPFSWSMANCLSICQATENSVLVLTKTHLYLINTELEIQEKFSLNPLYKNLTQLFIHEMKIYTVSDGKVYRMTINQTPKLKQLKQIKGVDITRLKIAEIVSLKKCWLKLVGNKYVSLKKGKWLEHKKLHCSKEGPVGNVMTIPKSSDKRDFALEPKTGTYWFIDKHHQLTTENVINETEIKMEKAQKVFYICDTLWVISIDET